MFDNFWVSLTVFFNVLFYIQQCSSYNHKKSKLWHICRRSNDIGTHAILVFTLFGMETYKNMIKKGIDSVGFSSNKSFKNPVCP